MKINKILTIICFVLLLISCGESQEREGQRQPLFSPSGKFIAEMPISKSNHNLDYPVWTPKIKDKDGKTIYEDNESDLSGYHNSYWDWDNYDRLWIYNSDTGEVTYYYISDGKYKKEIYATQDSSLIPPEIIRKKINIK